ncbi:unnamed protein product [Lampetra fluviatilis]
MTAGREIHTNFALTTRRQRVETQLSALTTALLHLVALVMPIAAGGNPVVGRPWVDEQRAGDGTLEGPPLVDTAAIPGGVETIAISQFPPNAQVAAAILGAATGSVASAGGSSLRREESLDIATLAAKDSADRGRRLPHVREFVAAGGDWSTFRWRFKAAYKLVRWSEEEALIALPTILDDDALAVFRSISPGKKATLTQAFAEMAEVYEPPDDRTRKCQHHRRGSTESPLAYRSALMALAVDAYPNVKREHLDPLVMERMLVLAREMDVVLPTCCHELKTSWWAARCLNAHENLKRWAQMAAWMGDLAKDGQQIGWSPSQVVVIPEDAPSAADVAAAVTP